MNNKPYNDTPYKGLNPYTEEDTLFFFGRKVWQEKVTNRLMVSRLTVLYGESGVGKSSLLQAGVANYLKLFGEENRKNINVPKIAVVVFNNWKENNQDKNILKKLQEKIKTAVVQAMKDKPEKIQRQTEEVIKKQKDKEQETREKNLEILNLKSENQNQKLDTVNSYPPSEFVRELQAYVEIISGEQGGGELFIILDQFEEYFQYHTQKGDEENFTKEFARAVNYPNLAVHFLISIRSDEFYRLEQAFQGSIFNILSNCIELDFLKQTFAKEAIQEPIERYNLIQCLRKFRLTVLTGDKYIGKSLMIKAGIIPYWSKSKSSKESKASDSEPSSFPPIVLDNWDVDPHNELVKQIQDKIGDRHNEHLLIIFDNFEKYIEACPSWELELGKVLTYIPGNLLISARDTYLQRLKSFTDKFSESRQEIPDYKVPYFILSENSLNFKNKEQLANIKIKIAEIKEEVFADKITEVLINLWSLD